MFLHQRPSSTKSPSVSNNSRQHNMRNLGVLINHKYLIYYSHVNAHTRLEQTDSQCIKTSFSSLTRQKGYMKQLLLNLQLQTKYKGEKKRRRVIFERMTVTNSKNWLKSFHSITTLYSITFQNICFFYNQFIIKILSQINENRHSLRIKISIVP